MKVITKGNGEVVPAQWMQCREAALAVKRREEKRREEKRREEKELLSQYGIMWNRTERYDPPKKEVSKNV